VLISIVTASDNSEYLDSCHRSLRNQTHAEWEWVVVQYGESRNWRPPGRDERVVVLRDEDVKGVSAAKRVACERAQGDVLVGLGHCDELGTTCLDGVQATFAEHPDVGLVYSDTAQIQEDGRRSDSRLDVSEGWNYTGAEVNDRLVLRQHGFEALPHNVASVHYAPNHVRAFRRSTYESVGGYDPARTILDDQDLMCRMYEAAPFFHIPECLYLERVLDTRPTAEIMANRRYYTETVELYDTYVQRLALAWAAREGLHALDLGAAHNKPEGYLGLDQYPGPSVDIVADITKGIDLPDNSVGVIRAVDFLEHIPDKIAMFNEIYRLLAHGGMLLSLTPSTDGRGAFQDPTHVAFYNENSFWYFTDRNYATFVPEITCQFQVGRMVTQFPSPWHRQHQISYVNANLIALKGGPRQGGICNW
jgi:hypothetical protein